MHPSWLSYLHLPSWVHLPTPSTARHVFYGILIGVSLSLTSTSVALYYQERKRERLSRQFEARPIELRSDEVIKGVTGLIGQYHSPYENRNLSSIVTLAINIGNTPLVRINSLSDALGVEILGKAEVRI